MPSPSLHYCSTCGGVAFIIPGSADDVCCGKDGLRPLPATPDRYALSYAVMLERQRCVALISEHADGNDGAIGDVAPLLMKIANPSTHPHP